MSLEAKILASIDERLAANEERRTEEREQIELDLNIQPVSKHQRFNNAVGDLMAEGQARHKARMKRQNPALYAWANADKKTDI